MGCIGFYTPSYKKREEILEKFIEPSDQILFYIQDLPFWPIALLGLVLLVGVGVDLVNRRRREGAVEYFESAFREELAGLYPIVTRWPEDLAAYIQPRLPVLRDAFEALRNFIPQGQLREYNAAWNRFYQFSRTGGGSQVASSEDSAQESVVNQPDLQQQQQAFQQIVSDLLAYTDLFKK